MIQDGEEKSVPEQAHKQRATLATFFSCSQRRISRVYDHRGRYVGCWELVFLLLGSGMLNLRCLGDNFGEILSQQFVAQKSFRCRFRVCQHNG